MVINRQDVEWIIYYTRTEIEQVLRAGDGRQDYALTMGLVNYGKKNLTPEEIRANHRLGTTCEWLAAGAFNLKFDPSIGKIDSVDLGIIEVRGRRIEPVRLKPDLTIRPKDIEKARIPHVLVRNDEARLRATIPGWLCAWEAFERKDNEWFEPGGVYFVKPPYHTPLSLKQWIECGHPVHHAPEKYCK